MSANRSYNFNWQKTLTMAKLRLLLASLLPLMGSSFSSHSSFLARPNDRLGVITANQASLSMHMGHSHSHHGHGHDTNAAKPLLRPTSLRRKISLLGFAACVVLAPQIVMKKTVSRAHGATFVFTVIALGMMDQIRSGFSGIVGKFRVRCKRLFLQS